MMQVALLAPWVATRNIGDQVIGDAVVAELRERTVLPVLELPTHVRPERGLLRLSLKMDRIIVGGSNILSSRMQWNGNFPLTPDLLLAYRHKVTLMGVGWDRYSESPGRLSVKYLRALLDPKAIHSTRDQYTADRLNRMGYEAVNTGCPTTWKLDATKIRRRPNLSRAIITVSDYAPNVRRDQAWISRVESYFPDLCFQPMSALDNWYLLRGVGCSGDQIMTARLRSYDAVLAKGDAVVVGTRLHGGIRALQMGGLSHFCGCVSGS